MYSLERKFKTLRHIADKNEAYLRYCELKDVVERLLEKHDDSHLDEEVRQTTTGVTLQRHTNLFVPGAMGFRSDLTSLHGGLWFLFSVVVCAVGIECFCLAVSVCFGMFACSTQTVSSGILKISCTSTFPGMYRSEDISFGIAER